MISLPQENICLHQGKKTRNQQTADPTVLNLEGGRGHLVSSSGGWAGLTVAGQVRSGRLADGSWFTPGRPGPSQAQLHSRAMNHEQMASHQQS